MGKWQIHKKHHIQESQEVSPFPAADYKVAWHRQKPKYNKIIVDEIGLYQYKN